MWPSIVLSIVTAVLLQSYVCFKSYEFRNVEVRQLFKSAGMSAAMIPLWWSLVAWSFSWSLQNSAPSPNKIIALVLAAVAVTMLMLHEILLDFHRGPLRDMGLPDREHERYFQMSTIFAVSAALLSDGGSAVVRPLVYASIALCVLAAVPSGSARKRVGAVGWLRSTQIGSLSLSAGLLALAVVHRIFADTEVTDSSDSRNVRGVDDKNLLHHASSPDFLGQVDASTTSSSSQAITV